MQGTVKNVEPSTQPSSSANLSLQAPAEVTLATGTMQARVLLSASSTDPLAVTAQIRVEGSVVKWVFGRDLLVLGLHTPTGEGVVRVTAAKRRASVPLVDVFLQGSEGTARLTLYRSDVVRFLELSDPVVRGEHNRQLLNLDLERELRDLLRDNEK